MPTASTKKKIPWSWYDLSETTRDDLVYYDTAIWAGYFLGERDLHYQESKSLIELVEAGKKRAIVSYLLIMETMYTIRRRKVERSDSPDDASRMSTAMDASDKFYNYVTNRMKTGRLILVESNREIDYKIFQKYSSVRGTVKSKEYRALGYADIEHAYLADYGGAREFHTTDLSFRDLDGDPDFVVEFFVHGSNAQRPAR